MSQVLFQYNKEDTRNWSGVLFVNKLCGGNKNSNHSLADTVFRNKFRNAFFLQADNIHSLQLSEGRLNL